MEPELCRFCQGMGKRSCSSCHAELRGFHAGVLVCLGIVARRAEATEVIWKGSHGGEIWAQYASNEAHTIAHEIKDLIDD